MPDVEPEKIELSIEKTTINKGEIIQLNAKVLPEDASNKTITYSSKTPNVATITSTGKITGISSGKATITAKTSNGVSSSIDITVYSPVTDIVPSTNKIVVQVDKEFTIHTQILPEDANNRKLKYETEDSQIAQVDENGKVTGISEGTTNIIVTSDENSNISKTISVTVTRKLQEGEIIFDQSLQVDGNEITGLENKNNTVDSLLNKIQTNYTIEIYNLNGKQITGSSLAGTGSTIKILDNNVQVTEYTLIMYGDVNGDGKINSVDLLVLQRHILEIEELTGVQVKAGNVRKNGKAPSSVDCLIIQRHILEIQKLEQRIGASKEVAVQANNNKKITKLKENSDAKIATLKNVDCQEQIAVQTNTANAEQILINSNKKTVEKNREFVITIKPSNTKLAAFTLWIYFESDKVECISELDNINIQEDKIIYTWYSSEGKNMNNVVELGFRAKQEGLATFSATGEFYTETGSEITFLENSIDVAIGKVAEEQLSATTQNTGTSQEENTTSDEVQDESGIKGTDTTSDAELNYKDQVPENEIAEVQNDENSINLGILRTNYEGITPNFDANITEYYLVVDESVDNLNITAVPVSKKAEVIISGNKNLKNGLNIVHITVGLSENSKTYTINVTKTNNIAQTNTNLETLAIENYTLVPEFANTTTNYQVEVANTETAVNILAIAESSNAKVRIDGNTNLQYGNNQVVVTVTAQDGITNKNYYINVHKRNAEEEKQHTEEIQKNNEEVNRILEEKNIETTENMEEQAKHSETSNSSINFIAVMAIVVIIVVGIAIILVRKKHN